MLPRVNCEHAEAQGERLTWLKRRGPETGFSAAVQHVIRNAGFHVGTMPLVDMRNGGSRYVVDARDADTGESRSVIADTEYEATVNGTQS